MININYLCDINHLIFGGQLTSPFCHVSLTMFLYPTLSGCYVFSRPSGTKHVPSGNVIVFRPWFLILLYSLIGLLTARFVSLWLCHLPTIPLLAGSLPAVQSTPWSITFLPATGNAISFSPSRTTCTYRNWYESIAQKIQSPATGYSRIFIRDY